MKNYLKNFFLVLAMVTIQIGDRVAIAQVSSAGDTNLLTLELGKPIEREMTASDTHFYQIALITGQFLLAVIDQRGIDVVVTVFDPDGKKISEIDSPNGVQGPEPVNIKANSSGVYRLEIKPLEESATPGRYEAKIKGILNETEYAAYLAEERAKYEVVKNWISSNAIPIRTVVAGNGFEDLQPLKKLIGNARIVSLGEATHGTREFWQLKHRMLEFLVNEMGFTVFAIEASMPEAFDINEYILTGIGNPEKALTGLQSWDTEEMLDMIRWMRHYNEDIHHLKKIKFYGFHTAGTSLAAKRVLEYLHKVDPEQALLMEEGMEVLANPFLVNHFGGPPYFVDNFQILPNEMKENTVALANSLLERFDEHRLEYIKRSSIADWTLARQYVIHIVQNLKWKTFPASIEKAVVRESAMVETIRWILDQEGADSRMVVWAHNEHVATISEGPYRSMGWLLRNAFGSDLVIFGFAFNQGSFQAFDLQLTKGRHPFTLGPAPEGSFDATLAAAGLSIAAIDFHRIPKDGPVAEWFGAPHMSRSTGSYHSEKLNFNSNAVLTREYDAILFVETTTEVRNNKYNNVPPTEILSVPKNLDFESSKAGDPPSDWVLPTKLASVNFQIVTSADRPRMGSRCAVIKRVPEEQYGEIEGSLRQVIDATSYREKRIKLRAWVRVEASDRNDKAYLWLRMLTQGAYFQTEVFYENMADRPIISNEWHAYEIIGEVPANAVTIEYGIVFVGDGQAYLDAVSLEEIQK